MSGDAVLLAIVAVALIWALVMRSDEPKKGGQSEYDPEDQ